MNIKNNVFDYLSVKMQFASSNMLATFAEGKAIRIVTGIKDQTLLLYKFTNFRGPPH